MTQGEMREIALGAARSELRQFGIEPKTADIYTAEQALDNILRSTPNAIAARWYENASDNQWELFKREWRRYQAASRRDSYNND